MNKFSAHAVRHGQYVEVTVQGDLPDSCHEIKIDGTYPGSIYHVVDPGHAEVFLRIQKKKDIENCTDALVPFSVSLYFPDDLHENVKVFAEGLGDLTIPINNTDKYIVLNMIGGIVPPPSYSIVTEDFEIIPHLYEKSFGPDSYENCSLFIENQKTTFSAGGGGGSGAPRG